MLGDSDRCGCQQVWLHSVLLEQRGRGALLLSEC